jgi:hypothetical protein
VTVRLDVVVDTGVHESVPALTDIKVLLLPALSCADPAVPLAQWPARAAYRARLKTRPAVARVLDEAAS